MSMRARFTLPGPEDREYWAAVREWAKELDSDGCSWVIDFRRDTCLEHDAHWRTGYTMFGDRITKWQANVCFREAIQQRSWLGRWSPMAAIRFIGVSIGALFHEEFD